MIIFDHWEVPSKNQAGGQMIVQLVPRQQIAYAVFFMSRDLFDVFPLTDFSCSPIVGGAVVFVIVFLLISV